MAECDIDDLVCQIQILAHLKGMQSLLGDEKFKTSYPEFEGLDTTLKEKIEIGEGTLREALDRCGLSPMEEIIAVEETVKEEE